MVTELYLLTGPPVLRMIIIDSNKFLARFVLLHNSYKAYTECIKTKK